MKILVINPNTSRSVTDKIADVARRSVSTGTTLEFVTAAYGVPYIATRAEAVIGGRVALEILAEREAEFDAAIIAAFGDPGLGAARELMRIPVVGLAEASLLMACPLGRSFSVVSFSSRLEPWYRECIAWHGLSNRLASIRMLDTRVADIARVESENRALLIELATRAVEEDAAEAIILAGAPLAGLASQVRDLIPVPVIEGVAASIKIAEGLVTLKPRKPVAGSFRQPAP
ncbi:MAG: aspartate/glutamate racemase family protein, partial [Candidatus Competibacterales bacterium]|nr:aspartate/glutamate racemase family protein [Candidatus Competibacterales bacterium]